MLEEYMDAAAVEADLVAFLVENHREIMETPISGCVRDLYAVFASAVSGDESSLVSNDDEQMLSAEQFLRVLSDITLLAPGAMTFKEDVFDGRTIVDMNIYLLQVLQKELSVAGTCTAAVDGDDSADNTTVLLSDESTVVNDESNEQDSEPSQLMSMEEKLRLLNLVNPEGGNAPITYEDAPLPMYLRQKLAELLAMEPMSYELGRERARATEPIAPFIPVCTDHTHAMLLAQTVFISNNKIVSLNSGKLSSLDHDHAGFMECVRTHIHYVPNIKPQTDLALGDCSYLDTCHKLNSCRYLHYLQYVPEATVSQVMEETRLANAEQAKHVPLYTHGACSSTMVKEPLPPQWIRCDVRRFDFRVLGKFSVVVADPAWNIHMNLPYGTCNDIELLELPLDELQDEGVLFLWVTGRAIELGKESLAKWGYTVMNEISWIKTNQLGRTIVTGRTGHWLNHSKEHLLVGLKGAPTWLNRHVDLDIIVSTTRETSRKPDELYGMIERMVGKHARKLEIFGRDHNIRPGWFTIGNQLTGSCVHELDIKARYDAWAATQPQSHKPQSLNATAHPHQNQQHNQNQTHRRGGSSGNNNSKHNEHGGKRNRPGSNSSNGGPRHSRK
ncbi:mRNA (N6-adenosine)-methyltransferase [Maudiozyma humilis]|uniref:mRNA m(6)A methyltransferase n=1 Tax=Maudiozyma humilis TaxID=51915 RepID=A0AAV5RS62_MAUHU|nr:mRNA (N6-adenosine)-methyltransferase [Kazachstania humilis]